MVYDEYTKSIWNNISPRYNPASIGIGGGDGDYCYDYFCNLWLGCDCKAGHLAAFGPLFLWRIK